MLVSEQISTMQKKLYLVKLFVIIEILIFIYYLLKKLIEIVFINYNRWNLFRPTQIMSLYGLFDLWVHTLSKAAKLKKWVHHILYSIVFVIV